RALVRRPRLLILDDATSATDPTVEAAILDGLRTELRATLVVVAYRVSTISLADRVLFLEDGRIAAEGNHAELLEFPPYQAMVRGFSASHGLNSRFVLWAGGVAAIAVVCLYVAARGTYLRLVTATERALAALRVRAFEHVHELSIAEQSEQKRGAFVARVTAD